MNIEPKKIIKIIVLIHLLILLIIGYFLIKTKIYDHYKTKGYTKNNLIITYLPTNITYDKLFINNKEISCKIKSKELKVDENTLTSYNELSLDCLKQFSDNEIVDITFYYNKQRIITKLKDNMF